MNQACMSEIYNKHKSSAGRKMVKIMGSNMVGAWNQSIELFYYVILK